MIDSPFDRPLSWRRSLLASFDHARAVAIQRCEAGEAHLLVVRTGDPFQPYRIVSAEAANEDEEVLSRVA